MDESQNMHKTAQLARFLSTSENMVFFGGAGVSTESGIPDFRSAQGLYAATNTYGMPPEELLSRATLQANPALFFRYYRENLVSPTAEPNAAHQALAYLEEMGICKAVVTQNVDGLHQAAGSKVVHELHGSNWRQYCVSCGQRFTLAFVLDAANLVDDVPRCTRCGGMVRPDVVLYQEALDEQVVAAAIAAIRAADLLIVGGTSLAVYPAAALIEYFRGGNLVVINLSVTPVDSRAQLVITEPIGKVLGEAVLLLGAQGRGSSG